MWLMVNPLHVNEDIPNAKVFFQHSKKKPLLPCKARDGVLQQVWCPSFMLRVPLQL